jgi:phage FluMu protein Com
MSKNAMQKLGFLSRCRKFFTPLQILLVYKSFIRPGVKYSSHLWGGAFQTILSRLDFVQRRAIRLVGDSSLTNELDPLQHGRNVSDLRIFYKYLFYKSVSNEIQAILPRCKTYNRFTKRSEIISQCRSNSFQQDCFNRVAPLWNKLPHTVFPNSFNV